MQKMLSHGAVTEDNWTVLQMPVETIPQGNILLPLKYWLEQSAELDGQAGLVGVWLDSDEEVEALADDLEQLPVVALNFPKFVDGRGFSSARLLRDRYDYKGEIRAIGNVIQDQLFMLQRCGFSQFCLADNVDLEAAAKSLNDFSDSYQTAADQDQPLFKRLR
ncbi:DUF934 domain-containing protein [Porticoccaceae bacterium]|nr:DUF934 domain-containing protein [Porticoccaceae bacterium]MDB9804968.1 DUF934 domain-containing protein [Porticoccaceae bacterium]MDB9948652.1 DUF934 domain-containing protein [Porticoccaceae bacterium]MDB9970151.1 DUF934 domain-containing protein [Porticoccaceae bacterium]MDC1453382.1 DUF934 domain-containing protein [Porticoccaceae bacterium]